MSDYLKGLLNGVGIDTEIVDENCVAPRSYIDIINDLSVIWGKLSKDVQGKIAIEVLK